MSRILVYEYIEKSSIKDCLETFSSNIVRGDTGGELRSPTRDGVGGETCGFPPFPASKLKYFLYNLIEAQRPREIL